MKDELLLFLLKALPKNHLSRLIGWGARQLTGAAGRQIIAAYARHFAVDLAEIEKPIAAYESLAEFFGRRLKPGARPIDAHPDAIVSPVDAAVSAVGQIERYTLLQAKGLEYSLGDLFQGSADAERLAGGHFATLYLSPRDYHWIHAPAAGRVTAYHHVPGTLYPVNDFAAPRVRRLFGINERLITFLEIRGKLLAVVKVGAMGVGNISVTYGDVRTNAGGRVSKKVVLAQPASLAKGAELGAFQLGSTVILVAEPGLLAWDDDLAARKFVKVGERIGLLAVQ